MPAALQIDWTAAEALYATGISAVEVASQFGVTPDVIRARAKRKGWSIARRRVTQELERRQHDSARPLVCRKLKSGLEDLPDVPKPSQRKVHSEILGNYVAALAKAEGWEPSTPDTINIYALSAPMVTALPQAGEVPAVTTDSTVTDAEVVQDSNVSDSHP